MKTLKKQCKNCDDTREWMFNEIIQNTALNSSIYTFVYACIRKTHFPRPTNYRNQFSNRKFPGIEKGFPASWNSHSNSWNENWTLSIPGYRCCSILFVVSVVPVAIHAVTFIIWTSLFVIQLYNTCCPICFYSLSQLWHILSQLL